MRELDIKTVVTVIDKHGTKTQVTPEELRPMRVVKK